MAKKYFERFKWIPFFLWSPFWFVEKVAGPSFLFTMEKSSSGILAHVELLPMKWRKSISGKKYHCKLVIRTIAKSLLRQIKLVKATRQARGPL